MEEIQEVPMAPRRRRRHGPEFKAQAVQACLQAGVSIAAVALHYQLNANLLRRWVAEHEKGLAASPARETMIVPSAPFIVSVRL